MATLYELTGEMIQFLEMLETDEMDPEIIADTFESLEGEIGDKLDAYLAVMKELLAEADKFEKEADRLLQKHKVLLKNADRLKKAMEAVVMLLPDKAIKTALNSYKIQKSGGKRKLTLLCEPEDLPEEYQKVTVAADQDALRKLLKDIKVDEVEGIARLEPQGEYLRIR